MVDPDQRDVQQTGQGLGSGDPQEDGPDQTGTVGHRHGVQVAESGSGLVHGLLDQGVEDLHVGTAGDLGDHPTVLLVQGHLGRDQVDAQSETVLKQGHRGLVAGGLQAQDPTRAVGFDAIMAHAAASQQTRIPFIRRAYSGDCRSPTHITRASSCPS